MLWFPESPFMKQSIRSSGWQRAVLAAWLIMAAPLVAADHIGMMDREHGEWVSSVLIGDPPARFRISTERVDYGVYTELAIDVVEADCVQRFVTLDVYLRNPIEVDLVTAEMEGALRVDRHPIHRIYYRAGAMAGDFVIHLFLMEIDGERAFWKEMAAGQTVRFRLPTERRDYYLRFPLHGFSEALQRATRLCNELPAEADRAYFQE